eukprot:671040-Prymnesium_polylepis.1
MPMMPPPPGAGHSAMPIVGASGGAIIASGRKLKILVRLRRRFPPAPASRVPDQRVRLAPSPPSAPRGVVARRSTEYTRSSCAQRRTTSRRRSS